MADVRAVCVDGPCANEIHDIDDGAQVHTLRGKSGTGEYRLTDTPVPEYDTLTAKAFRAEYIRPGDRRS